MPDADGVHTNTTSGELPVVVQVPASWRGAPVVVPEKVPPAAGRMIGCAHVPTGPVPGAVGAGVGVSVPVASGVGVRVAVASGVAVAVIPGRAVAVRLGVGVAAPAVGVLVGAAPGAATFRT